MSGEISKFWTLRLCMFFRIDIFKQSKGISGNVWNFTVKISFVNSHCSGVDLCHRQVQTTAWYSSITSAFPTQRTWTLPMSNYSKICVWHKSVSAGMYCVSWGISSRAGVHHANASAGNAGYTCGKYQLYSCVQTKRILSNRKHNEPCSLYIQVVSDIKDKCFTF